MNDAVKDDSLVAMEWLMEDAIQKDAGVSLARMTVAPDTLSELHSHPNCTEAIHVEQGTIRQRCGDEWMILEQGQTCLIPKGYSHQTQNIGAESAVLILAYSSGTRIYET